MSHLCLHHRWSLRSKHFDGLEDVHHALVTHPLQHDTECDKDSGATDTGATKKTVDYELLESNIHVHQHSHTCAETRHTFFKNR